MAGDAGMPDIGGSGEEPVIGVRVSSGAEVVDLVRRLRALDWSWRLADASVAAAAMGWTIDLIRPGWVMLDTGFGTDSGSIRGADGRADEIEARVTDFASDDETGQAEIRAVFVKLADALIAEFGLPTARIPGETAQVRWGGPATTVVLRDLGVAVAVSLVTNDRLGRDDRSAELAEQGVL